VGFETVFESGDTVRVAGDCGERVPEFEGSATQSQVPHGLVIETYQNHNIDQQQSEQGSLLLSVW
jgi:hypothetical protein